MITEIARTWYIVVGFSTLYCLVAFVGTWKLARAYEPLGGAIRSYEDLAIVRRAINSNMRLAIGLIGLFGIYLCVLLVLFLTGQISLFTAIIYTLVLTTSGHLCAILYLKKAEKRVKATPVISDDPRVAETYERWLKEWKGARLQLSE